MLSFNDYLSQKLSKRKEEGLLRTLPQNKPLIDFCSNDYLGLARSEELYDLIQRKIQTLPQKFNGATGSRLISGNSPFTEVLENKLAKFFHAEAALLFNSGYAANQAVLSCLPQKNDTILYDELAHACIKDGARLNLATRHPFKHNDIEDLEKKITRSKPGRIFIAIESVYSMDGDQAPLTEIIKRAAKYDCTLVLDEAHSTGVFGEFGSGLVCALRLEDKIDVRIHTFGKALGVHGACVVGSKELIQYLINFARPFIYTTALPQHSLASIDCSLDFLKNNTGIQNKLKDKVDLFLKYVNIPNRTPSNSPVQTAIFRGNDRVKNIALMLQQKGFDVRPILSPTVPANTERLRICLHTYNSEEEIQKLAEALNQC